MKRFEVILERLAEKQFRKLPEPIRKALRTWTLLIEEEGISAMRMIPGYHDEPLKGDRQGQRSSRLNIAYRVIYREQQNGELVIISVIEVNKHDY